MPHFFTLIPLSFFAGFLTFLAPCTLPFIPGYLGFISGVSLQEGGGSSYQGGMRRKVFFHSIFYVLGFTFIFVGFGLVVGLGGTVLATYRSLLSRIGGVFVILLGLSLLHILPPISPRFVGKKRIEGFSRVIVPGGITSAFLLGVVFALAWSPCIGPILGSVLVLVASGSTAMQGAILLLVFSLGLGIPFLLIAIGFDIATPFLVRAERYMPFISIFSGIILLLFGLLLLTNTFAVWVSYLYSFFSLSALNAFLNYL